MDMEETNRRRRWKRSSVVAACLLATVVVLFARSWIDDVHEMTPIRPRSGGASSHERETSNKITGERRKTNRTGVNEATPPGQMQRVNKGSSGNQIAVHDMFAADHRSMHFILGYQKKKKTTSKLTTKMKTKKGNKKKAQTFLTKKKTKTAAKSPPTNKQKDKVAAPLGGSKAAGRKPSNNKPNGKPSKPKPNGKPSKPGRKPSNNKPKGKPSKPKPKGKPSKPKPKGKPSRPGRKPSNKPKGKPGGGVMGKPKRCSESSSEYKQCCSAWKKPSFYSRCTMLGCRTEDCPRFALASMTTHMDSSYMSPSHPFDFSESTSTSNEGTPITAHTGGLLCTSEKQKRCCLGNTRPDFQEYCLNLGCESTTCIHHVERDHLLKASHDRT